MRPVLLAAILLAACGGPEGPGERTGRALDRAAERTGQAVGHGARQTGSALERAGHWVGDRVDPAARR